MIVWNTFWSNLGFWVIIDVFYALFLIHACLRIKPCLCLLEIWFGLGCMLLGLCLNVHRVLHLLCVWSVLSKKFFMFFLCLICFFFVFRSTWSLNSVGSKPGQTFKACVVWHLLDKIVFGLRRCLKTTPLGLFWQFL